MKKTLCLLCLFSFFYSPLHAADILYVQSLKAKIFSEPNFSSELIGQAQRGTELQIIEEGNGWYKVSSNAQVGWINRLCVGNNPPMQKVTVITEETPDLEKNARKRASETTSSAAARGLTPSERKRLNNEHAADYHNLHELITFTEGITEEEVEHFIQSQETQQDEK